MARRVGAEKAKAVASECDDCMQRHGRNAQIVHFLKFPSEEDLRFHLMNGMEGDKVRVDPHLKFYSFVVRYYGQFAREKYQPIWLTYLEGTGCTVKNRATAILNYRRTHGHAAMIREL
jgi:hypothetical protein